MKKALGAFALVMLCVAGPAFAASPADILAANLAAMGDWSAKHTLRTAYAYSGQGMSGKVQSVADLDRPRFVDSFAIGPITGANGYDGAAAWAKDQSGTVTRQEGADAVELAVNEAYRNTNAWWRASFGGAEVVAGGTKTDGGASYDVLTVTPKGGTAFDAWFDGKTHLLYRTTEKQGSVLMTVTMTDYRKSDGAMVPGTIVQDTGDAKYNTTLTLLAATFDKAQPDAVFAMPTTTVADFTIAGGAKETTLPFELISNHIYAQVKVNGKGPYLFIFDTGGVNILTPSLAKELGLPVEGKSAARGTGEGTMEYGFAKVKSLSLAGATIADQVFIALPLEQLRAAGGTDEKGIVGYETFRRFVTRIDYGAKTITLIDPTAFDPKDAGTPIKLAFSGNAAMIQGSFNGIPGTFQIDTGARSSLTLNAPFIEKNKLRERYPAGISTVGGWGVGGASREVVVRGDDLRIGAVDVPKPVTGMSVNTAGAFADPTLAGNIGGGTLKRFVVTFDYGHAVMYLKPVGVAVSDLDTFDRAGMWFNLDDAGFKVVDVTAGAPAAEAGLANGDIITAVDGTPASRITLSALRERLRNDAPGTVVTFTVKRDGDTKDVKVTLRDLI